MKITKSDLVLVLTLCIGIATLASDPSFSSLLNSTFGPHAATTVLMGLTLLGIVASLLMKALSAPAGQSVDVGALLTQIVDQVVAAVKSGPAPEIHVHVPPPAPLETAPPGVAPSSSASEQPIQGAPAAAAPAPAAPPQGAP